MPDEVEELSCVTVRSAEDGNGGKFNPPILDLLVTRGLTSGEVRIAVARFPSENTRKDPAK